MKVVKIIHWVGTILLSLLMLFSAFNYFFNYEMIVGFFKAFGYPTYIIYPLAVLKILGVVAITTKKVKWLTEWAYAGFFFDIVLAAQAHISIGDGQQGGAFMALVLFLVSFITYRRLAAM